MMNRATQKTVNTTISLILAAVLMGMIFAVFLLSQNFILRMIVCGGSVIIAVCLYVMHRIARTQFVQFTESVCGQLDRVIENEPDININLEEETLLSKIGAKLLKISEVTRGAAEQSEQLKKHIQELVSDITHQLKTPLSNIKMAAETLEDENIDTERRHFFVSGLKHQVGKLEFLIEAMTKISRLENGMIIPQPRPEPLSELIETAISAIRPLADEKQIDINSEETQLSLNFDMRWTSEALFNILDNAVKYTPERGQIIVSVHPMVIYTRIDIRDTGIGIMPEHINDIFKRFYRENRLRQTNGVGVGLYLAREIISRQGGYITAKSIVDKETIISVYLQNSDTFPKV